MKSLMSNLDVVIWTVLAQRLQHCVGATSVCMYVCQLWTRRVQDHTADAGHSQEIHVTQKPTDFPSAAKPFLLCRQQQGASAGVCSNSCERGCAR